MLGINTISTNFIEIVFIIGMKFQSYSTSYRWMKQIDVGGFGKLRFEFEPITVIL